MRRIDFRLVSGRLGKHLWLANRCDFAPLNAGRQRRALSVVMRWCCRVRSETSGGASHGDRIHYRQYGWSRLGGGAVASRSGASEWCYTRDGVDRAAALGELALRSERVVVGDLQSGAETKGITDQMNAIGRMDAIIHYAGVYTRRSRGSTPEGHAGTLAINTRAPYLLTALIERPARLVYLTSGCIVTGKARWMTLIGPKGLGIRPGPMPRASCTSSRLRPRWRDAGQAS
ncbi:hypothetical protein ACVW1C_005522 [Bradyrhizobium sp. USDA 4011]